MNSMIPLNVKEILENIRDEKNGYKIVKPWRWDKKALGIVVPVTNELTGQKDRAYVTEHEVSGDKIKVEDTGDIEKLKIEVTNDKPVFFRTGTIFGGKAGDTQERGLQKSVIVGKEPEPGQTFEERELNFHDQYEAPVRCVHASKGINTGTSMESSRRYAPASVTSNLMGGDQRSVWSSVSKYDSKEEDNLEGFNGILQFDDDMLHSIGAEEINNSEVMTCEYHGEEKEDNHLLRIKTLIGNHNRGNRRETLHRTSSRLGRTYGSSATQSGMQMRTEEPSLQALNSNFFGFSSSGFAPQQNWNKDDLLQKVSTQKMDDMLRKVPYTEFQLGAFLLDVKGIMGFEIFDSSKSWKAVKDAIIAQYGNEISDTEANIPFTVDDETVRVLIKEFINNILKSENHGSPIEHRNALTQTFVFGEKRNFVGEYSLLDNEPIHILASRG